MLTFARGKLTFFVSSADGAILDFAQIAVALGEPGFAGGNASLTFLRKPYRPCDVYINFITSVAGPIQLSL